MKSSLKDLELSVIVQNLPWHQLNLTVVYPSHWLCWGIFPTQVNQRRPSYIPNIPHDVSHLSYQPSSKNSESSPKFPKVPWDFSRDLLLSSKEPSAVQIKAVVPTNIVQAPAALADTKMLEEDVETHQKKRWLESQNVTTLHKKNLVWIHVFGFRDDKWDMESIWIHSPHRAVQQAPCLCGWCQHNYPHLQAYSCRPWGMLLRVGQHFGMGRSSVTTPDQTESYPLVN